MGRPPGTAENEQLVHVRLPDELKRKLERIRDSEAVKSDPPPSVSSLIRQAIREFVDKKAA